MRRATLKKAAALRRYAILRKQFLADNPACIRCAGWAYQIHHRAGRVGKLLLDTSHWGSVCGDCHRYITEHPQEAISAGWSESRFTA